MTTWLAGGRRRREFLYGVLHRHCFFFGRTTWQDKGFEDQATLHFLLFDVHMVFSLPVSCFAAFVNSVVKGFINLKSAH
jgi:hypothetical protein